MVLEQLFILGVLLPLTECQNVNELEVFGMTEDNVVYIGKKPVMNYVLATITVFNEGSNDAVIKARGRAISRAVDTAEVIRTRFLPNVKVKDIKIGTDAMNRDDGKESNISWIEIYLIQGKNT